MSFPTPESLTYQKRTDKGLEVGVGTFRYLAY